jgi:hypothetical protein
MELYGREFQGTELIRMLSYKLTLREVIFEVVMLHTHRSKKTLVAGVIVDIE